MDTSTLFAVNIFGMALCGIALTMSAIGSRSVRIPISLILCSFSGCLGMLFFLFYGRVNNPAFGLAGGFFLQLTFVFMYRGYSWMTQLPPNSLLMRGWQILLAQVVLNISVVAYLVYFTNDYELRIVIFSLGMIFCCVSCIVLLLRVPDIFLREASWLTILCLGLYVFGSTVRLISVMLHPPTEAYLNDFHLQPGLILTSMIAIAGITYGHIWITGARQRITLQSQAYTDELTGVLNRRALEIEAEREISRSRRSHTPLAVMMCDLDNFKLANDSFGHQYGDALLRSVANALRNTLRREDQIARLGGDEFVILLPGASRERALEVAERLRGEIEHLHVVEQGRSMSLQASFGIAMLDDLQDSMHDTWLRLSARADAALYAAKHVGGNHIMIDPVPDEILKQLDIKSKEQASEKGLKEPQVPRRPNVHPGSTTIQ